MFGKVNEDSFQNILDSSSLFFNLGSAGSSVGGDSSFSSFASSPASSSSGLHASASSPLLFGLSSTETLFSLGSLGNPSSNVTSPIGTGRTSQLFRLSEPAPEKKRLSASASTSSLQKHAAAAATTTVASGNGNANRYKTELCRPFQESGSCKYGEKCQFAHGRHELRSISRHPKYKTDLCRTYHSVGFCPYGPRCHFIHNLDELKSPEANATASNNPAAAQLANSTTPALATAAAVSSNPGGMPPLPMFTSPEKDNSGLTLAAAHQALALRLRRTSDCGYNSSSSSASSVHSQSPSSLCGADYDEVDTLGRLPVFSTISK